MRLLRNAVKRVRTNYKDGSSPRIDYYWKDGTMNDYNLIWIPS